ncbi:metal-dependent hydrolase [Natronomonas sp. EA1]|uniref:metal-dependent hydrolase n=1 Tax=Natronomonas sp. EA1 TaxID=3421655 RepID=UPI003EC14B1F
MMGTTHAAMGALLALPVVWVAPAYAPFAVSGGIVGSLLPDLDLFVGTHRRSCHFPVLLWLPAGVAGAWALAAPSAPAVTVAFLLLGAAVHSGVDVLGGPGDERAWEGDSHVGVYSHLRKRWLPPRRWIRYDGAPEDVLLYCVLAVPVAVGFPRLRPLLAAGLVVSVVYALLRKRLG